MIGEKLSLSPCSAPPPGTFPPLPRGVAQAGTAVIRRRVLRAHPPTDVTELVGETVWSMRWKLSANAQAVEVDGRCKHTFTTTCVRPTVTVPSFDSSKQTQLHSLRTQPTVQLRGSRKGNSGAS